MTVEKNDVDVNQLFNWSKSFEIIGENGEVADVVYMRLLGDADLNKARVFALRKSAELRKLLKDENSDEHVAFIQDKDTLKKSHMVQMIILLSTRDLTKDLTNKVKIDYPKAPKSDAPLEVMEKYQKEVDEFPEKRRGLIKKALESEIKKLEKEYNSKNEDELYDLYIKALVDEMCEQEVLNRFRESSTFYGTFSDKECKERYFKSFDEFENLPSKLKTDFMQTYSTLEIGMEELKKLREVMP